jgi:hypothetical protein
MQWLLLSCLTGDDLPLGHNSVWLYEDGSGYLNMRSANGSGDQKYLAPTAFKFVALDNITWGVAAGGSQAWTWDTGAATDPAVTFSDGVVNVSAGALQVAGTAVSVAGHTHAVGPDDLTGDTVDDGFVDPAIGGNALDLSAADGLVFWTTGVPTLVTLGTAPGATIDLTDFVSGNPSVGDTPTWDGTNWVPDTPSSGAAYDDITAPDANSTIAFAGFTNTWTSTLDSGNVFTISNTDADLDADTILQVLKFTDDGDANGFFQKFFDNAGNDLKYSLDSDGDLYIAGSLTVGASGASVFVGEGATADDFELTMNLIDPTADRTQAFENASGLVVVTQEVDKTIWQPDLIATTVPILHVDVLKYPYGIKLLGVQITLSADAAYAMVFEEWAGDAPAAQNDIETVTTGAGDSYMEVLGASIDDSDIDADDYLFLHIPATDVPWIAVKVIFYAKTS